MKIFLDKVPPEGTELVQTYASEELDVDSQDIKVLTPIGVKVRANKEGNGLSIMVNIEGTMQQTCGRCLKELFQPLLKHFHLYFLIKGENFVDIIENIREEIILSYPLKALCKPDCHGLCPACGQDLNEKQCDCLPNSS